MRAPRLGVLISLLCGAIACGGGGKPGTAPGPSSCEQGKAYASTFEAIQDVIFERHGCTERVCHGAGRAGGLDLRPQVAYEDLLDAASGSSPFPRVLPGDKSRSFLWLKLAAKTFPGSVEIAGAPMPNNLPAISPDELEALRLWIYSGAPRTGTVAGTESLLDACLPAPEPITIKPLDPPAAADGFQLQAPPWRLDAGAEGEICFATYYDLSEVVPKQFQDPTGSYFRFAGQELRQDPQSHHLVLNYSGVPAANLHDPSFGAWTCKGGERDGVACEPTDQGACGAGVCTSEFRPTVGCVGYGPPSPLGEAFLYQVGGAQQAQANLRFLPGVYAQVPLRGVLYWNWHAFNLTARAHTMAGRLNFYFARDQRFPIRPLLGIGAVFAANAPPYTTQTVCADYALPRGARLFGLTSHTHKRNKRFTAYAPDGSVLLESAIYNDPTKRRFDPPLAFDAEDAAARTLRYCGLYNNGVADDGSPDPETVTRASRIPESARSTIGRCRPVACAAGTVGAPCNGESDNAACDSMPGAGDGWCDACRITGGESTENDMFILIGQYYIDPAFPQPDDDLVPGGIASLPNTHD